MVNPFFDRGPRVSVPFPDGEELGNLIAINQYEDCYKTSRGGEKSVLVKTYTIWLDAGYEVEVRPEQFKLLIEIPESDYFHRPS